MNFHISCGWKLQFLEFVAVLSVSAACDSVFMLKSASLPVVADYLGVLVPMTACLSGSLPS